MKCDPCDDQDQEDCCLRRPIATPLTDAAMEACGKLPSVETMYGYMVEHSNGLERDLNEALSALRALVSCVERDQGKGGILLPTEAAISKAKEVLRANERPD